MTVTCYAWCWSLLRSVVRTSNCVYDFYFIFSITISYHKTNWNGGAKCAINQTKPYPLLFVSSTMQPTIIVDAEAIFKKSDWIGVNKKYMYLLKFWTPETLYCKSPSCNPSTFSLSTSYQSGLQEARKGPGQNVAWYYSQISHFYSILSALETRYVPHSGNFLALNKARYIFRTDLMKTGPTWYGQKSRSRYPTFLGRADASS